MTVDIWSNTQMRSYIGVTVHFMSNWKLHNASLVCRRFKVHHKSTSNHANGFGFFLVMFQDKRNRDYFECNRNRARDK